MSLYSPAGGYLCYLKFARPRTQTIYLLLYSYLFEGCYFGAIMRSAKIAKFNACEKNTSYTVSLLSRS